MNCAKSASFKIPACMEIMNMLIFEIGQSDKNGVNILIAKLFSLASIAIVNDAVDNTDI